MSNSIREMIEGSGLRQSFLAQRVGLSEADLSRLKYGRLRRPLTQQQVSALAEALQVERDALEGVLAGAG